VTANGDALRLLRVGLLRTCVMPTDAAIRNFGGISGDLIALKSLAKLLIAEGRLAELENRPADAARSYLDAIRLGTKMSRGGFMINRLVGIACEGMGTIPLVKLLPKLSCEQMRPLVTELEQIDAITVTWREVLRNENRFARAQMGKYPNPIRLISDLWQARGERKLSEQRHDLAAAHLRLLTTELALRCYRCDLQTAPATLEKLVPNYIHRVPSDPFSGQPVLYRRVGTNWSLYSLGPDRRDGGGKPMVLSLGDDPVGFGAREPDNGHYKGDLFYDSPW